MSTQDVPGYGSAASDVLAMGHWAEHKDGSLLLVESTEGGRVVYVMFDMAQDPPVEYRDAMPEKGFKETFSWNSPGKMIDQPWSWHDKTPFPWEEIIKYGFPAGQRSSSANAVLSAAQRIAESLRLRKRRVDPQNYEHLKERSPTGRGIIERIQKVLDEFRE
jgi:hypothetical protein